MMLTDNSNTRVENNNIRLVKIRFTLGAILFLGNFFLSISELQGQGRLGRVRENVRRHESPPQSTHSNDDDHDHHDDHADRHRSRRRRSPRNRSHHGHHGGLHFSSGFFAHDYCEPHVVEHVHVYEPAPVIVTQPVQPIYEPVIVEQESGFDEPVMVMDPCFDNYFGYWSGRLSATFGYDFDNLSHGSLGLLIQSPGGIGLDSSVTMFRESGTTFRDHLWLGDVNLVYEAINAGDIRARMGVGINWLGDYYGGEAGANLTFGMDWQVTPEWVVTGETDFGSIGDSDLFHAQLSLGRQFGNAEWTTGYNYYDIGGATIDGLFTGLRFRF